MNAEQVERLTRFIEARLRDDEQVAAGTDLDGDWQLVDERQYGRLVISTRRVTADVVSKRRILTEVVAQIDGMDRQIEVERGSGLSKTTGESDLLLKLLAAPYDSHPAWDEAWRP